MRGYRGHPNHKAVFSPSRHSNSLKIPPKPHIPFLGLQHQPVCGEEKQREAALSPSRVTQRGHDGDIGDTQPALSPPLELAGRRLRGGACRMASPLGSADESSSSSSSSLSSKVKASPRSSSPWGLGVARVRWSPASRSSCHLVSPQHAVVPQEGCRDAGEQWGMKGAR